MGWSNLLDLLDILELILELIAALVYYQYQRQFCYSLQQTSITGTGNKVDSKT